MRFVEERIDISQMGQLDLEKLDLDTIERIERDNEKVVAIRIKKVVE